MKWSYWISLYIRTHCVARGLRPLTLAAYETALEQFRDWIRLCREQRPPDAVTARDVLEYLQHLREVRGNGDAAVNRQLTILRSFYRAIVAMGHLEPAANPLAGFPSIKAVPRKLPVSLSPEQVSRLLAQPRLNTIIGLRDRAVLALLYGTGIRVSECADFVAAASTSRVSPSPCAVRAGTNARSRSTRNSRKFCASTRMPEEPHSPQLPSSAPGSADP